MREYLRKILVYIDANAASHIVEIGKGPRMRNVVTDVLKDAIIAKPDPTERHWLYVALGSIGGKKAESAVKRGLHDNNEFVRRGAEIAMESIQATNQMAQHKWLLGIVVLLLCVIIVVIAAAIIYFLTIDNTLQPINSRTSSVKSPQPKSSDITIRVERGNKGDIWIHMFDDREDSIRFGIESNSPPPSRYLEIKM